MKWIGRLKCLWNVCFVPIINFFFKLHQSFVVLMKDFVCFVDSRRIQGPEKVSEPNQTICRQRSWNFQQLIGAVWYYLIFCQCRSNDSYFQESWSIFSRANVLRSCYSSPGSFQNEMIYSWVLPVVQRTEDHYGKKLRMITGLSWSLLNIRGVPMDVDFIFCIYVLMMMIISIILYFKFWTCHRYCSKMTITFSSCSLLRLMRPVSPLDDFYSRKIIYFSSSSIVDETLLFSSKNVIILLSSCLFFYCLTF